MTWTTKTMGSERTQIGGLECDVWMVCGGARYSVLDTSTGRYLASGTCASVEWAKEVSVSFARSAGKQKCDEEGHVWVGIGDQGKAICDECGIDKTGASTNRTGEVNG